MVGRALFFVFLASVVRCNGNLETLDCPIKLTLRDASAESPNATHFLTDTGSAANTSQRIMDQPLRLRTAVVTTLSHLALPIKTTIVVVLSTIVHAIIFRRVLPPLITALKSSELGDVDLSPDAITRNSADFIMDYVCEV